MYKKPNDFWSRLRITLFSISIVSLGAVGLIVSIRPKESALEKRSLSEFPSISISGALNGSWLKDISTWYVDSYPLRERMIAMQSKTEELYGIRNTAIYGDTGNVGEEIPDINNVETAPTLNIDELDDDSSDALATADVSDNDDLNTEAGNSINEVPDKNAVNAAMVNNESADDALATATSTGKVTAKKADGGLSVKPEKAGTVYVADKRGFELYYFNKKGVDTYASMLNTVKKKVGSSVNMYDIVVPNSFGVNLDEDIQKSMRASNQGDAINYIYKRLDSSIKAVETYDTLRAHNSEYLYFKTDHHWTARGAYYAYRSFCEKKGITPNDLSRYEKKKFSGFLGSFYAYSNQSKALASNLDTVEAFIPMSTNEETIHPAKGKPYKYAIISDASKMGKSNKYLAFIGGDQPLISITNPKLNDGSACIIVKESYGNAFVPFLVDHYQYVYVVDYRHYKGNATKLAQKHSKTDLIFLNNTEATGVLKSKQMLKIFK